MSGEHQKYLDDLISIPLFQPASEFGQISHQKRWLSDENISNAKKYLMNRPTPFLDSLFPLIAIAQECLQLADEKPTAHFTVAPMIVTAYQPHLKKLLCVYYYLHALQEKIPSKKMEYFNLALKQEANPVIFIQFGLFFYNRVIRRNEDEIPKKDFYFSSVEDLIRAQHLFERAYIFPDTTKEASLCLAWTHLKLAKRASDIHAGECQINYSLNKAQKYKNEPFPSM